MLVLSFLDIFSCLLFFLNIRCFINSLLLLELTAIFDNYIGHTKINVILFMLCFENLISIKTESIIYNSNTRSNHDKLKELRNILCYISRS